MELSNEIILTLLQLHGVANVTIFKIAQQVKQPLTSVEDLCDFWKTLKGKKLEEINKNDIIEAYDKAKELMERSEKASIRLISYYDSIYPDILRATINEKEKLDPPLILWYRGDLEVIKMPSVAFIGTREATPEGVSGGTYLSGEFAKRGFNIVSGLALGCDTCGHKGALKVGGKTTAFLANGLDHNSIYPSENKDLAEDIVSNGGLLLSEYPMGQSVKKYGLVARDRLQAGLSLATIVIQTGINGGTMHAANTTLKANKPLFVMKFKDDATNNQTQCLGNTLLVNQGAKYISGRDNIDEICQQLLSD